MVLCLLQVAHSGSTRNTNHTFTRKENHTYSIICISFGEWWGREPAGADEWKLNNKERCNFSEVKL